MQDGGGATGLSGSWLGRVYDDPRVALLMETRTGQYLSSHPFLALTALVFSATAAPPVGIFLAFSLVTVVTSAAVAAFVAACLLLVGGVALLCALAGLAAFSVLVSSICSVFYVATSDVLIRHSSHLTKGVKVHRTENWCDTSTAKETQ